ncbi:YqgE/AlgH family protein [Pannonibacter sp.]|uniref:YqgE/AlgH family protein n=1 Tax=Pannonibacter sp. TaxID=1906786 RepID=UPI0039515A33
MAQRLQEEWLDGKFLIAMPNMADGRFAHSVIYVCAHSSEGAMGLVLNQPSPHLSIADLLLQLSIVREAEAINLSPRLRRMNVHRGGPVETERGFVLHSDDFLIESATLPIHDGICLTATLEILRAIAEDRGPSRAMLALGYAGWAPGQLEHEIQANGWLTGPADAELIFDPDQTAKWERALWRIGVDPAMLSTDAGHA